MNKNRNLLAYGWWIGMATIDLYSGVVLFDHDLYLWALLAVVTAFCCAAIAARFY